MASNILQHVKYKHKNLGIATNIDLNISCQQKKVVVDKKQTIQSTRSSSEVVQQRPTVHQSITEDKGAGIVPTTKPKRTTKRANPNKDIIKRANKGGQHKLKSLAELATLFEFEGDLLTPPDSTIVSILPL